MTEVASIFGEAIHKPDLGYVRLRDDQLRAAMTGMGMSLHVVNLLLEASAALKSGHMRALEPRSGAKHDADPLRDLRRRGIRAGHDRWSPSLTLEGSRWFKLAHYALSRGAKTGTRAYSRLG